MRYRQRLRRLEAYQRQRRGRSHHLSVVHYPWDLPDEGRARWRREELPCACGRGHCPQMTIGLLVPATAPSVEAWAERAQQYYAQRRNRDA
jgi:hypothetical protein